MPMTDTTCRVPSVGCVSLAFHHGAAATLLFITQLYEGKGCECRTGVFEGVVMRVCCLVMLLGDDGVDDDYDQKLPCTMNTNRIQDTFFFLCVT